MANMKPKLDDSYWFDFSEKVVTAATEKRDQAASKLQKLVLWLWGIYTTYAAVGFALSEKSMGLAPVIIIISASGFLIAVYWSTVWVQMPIYISFDPRSPDDIRDAYSTIIRTKAFRLNFTLFLSVVAAIMVTVALFVASIDKNEKMENNFFAEISQKKNNQFYLVLTANTGVTEKVTVRINPVKSDSTQSSVYILKPTDGFIQTSLPIKPTKKNVIVQLEWLNKKGITTNLSKEIINKNN